MYDFPNYWHERIARTDPNDPRAMAELRASMLGTFRITVRRALETGRGNLAPRVLEAAREYARNESASPADPEVLVHRITRWVCDSIIEEVHRSRHALETVRGL